MMIISISSLKGGTAKSSNTIFLGKALHDLGKKTLVIDCDPNNNTTDYFLRDNDPEEIINKSIYQVLSGAIHLEQAIHKTDTVDIIPAAPVLAKISVEMAGDPGALLRFRSALKKLDYEYILIDTAPALGFELRVSLYAADSVLVPVGLSRWTLQGFDILTDEVQKVENTTGFKPVIFALPSCVSPHESKLLREDISLPYTKTDIPRNNSIKSCATKGTALKKGSIGEYSYACLAKEIIDGIE